MQIFVKGSKKQYIYTVRIPISVFFCLVFSWDTSGADWIFRFFLCFLFLFPPVNNAAVLCLHCSIETDNQVGEWFLKCTPIFHGKGVVINLVHFQPCYILFDCIHFLSRYSYRLLDWLVGNFFYDNSLTCLYYGSNNHHLFESDGLFNLDICRNLIAEVFKIFTCFYTLFLCGVLTETFWLLDIVQWMERKKVSLKKKLQLILSYITYTPPILP